jgi:hypothetical protein
VACDVRRLRPVPVPFGGVGSATACADDGWIARLRPRKISNAGTCAHNWNGANRLSLLAALVGSTS